MVVLKTKLRRKFNGKYYKFYDSYNTKEEAEKEADKLRARGNQGRGNTPASSYG